MVNLVPDILPLPSYHLREEMLTFTDVFYEPNIMANSLHQI